ncbi:MAG: SDR family NAD(P)-dependent oxidoreductase [Rhodoferax sp.]|jgi:NAD(P)-dependent dehydrogenase (short-subunit alcohol dehydrogenase family)
MHTLTILTGASRGMGLALARQLCRADARLLCLSRSTVPELDALAQQRGADLQQWPADLSDPGAVALRVLAWLGAQDAAQLESATLINNAGVIGRLGPLDPAWPDDVASTMRIDLEAPLQLSAAFLTATRDWPIPKKILNISSGLGRRAMAGSALYCAAKAGMDHFSRCVALDEARQPHGVRIVSLAPGVVDTNMQTTLRAGDPALFPEHANFVALKDKGVLLSPEEAASRVLAYLARSDFGSQPVADVRDA